VSLERPDYGRPVAAWRRAACSPECGLRDDQRALATRWVNGYFCDVATLPPDKGRMNPQIGVGMHPRKARLADGPQNPSAQHARALVADLESDRGGAAGQRELVRRAALPSTLKAE